MEIVSNASQVLGLVAILSAAALVFTRLVAWIFGKRRDKVLLGIELVLAFAVTYLFIAPAMNLISLADHIPQTRNVIAVLFWLSLAFTLDAAIKRFIWEGVMEHGDDRHVPKLLRDIVTALIYAVAVMIIMHFVYDEPITAVLATSGVAAFVIGFSAQSTLGEIFSGLSLNATRALRVGDYLEINGIYGRVYDINWRSISLHNPHTDSLYVFPNSVVASSVVLNYSTPTERFKNTVKFVVEFSASPALVISLITDALKNTRYVLRDPAPDFNILGFTDLGMEFRLRYYFDGDDPWWDAQNEVCTVVWSSLRKAGIHLGVDRHKLMTGDELEASPWTDLHIPVWDQIRNALAESEIFRDIKDEDLNKLIESAQIRDYSPPDCIYRVGEEGRSLFIVSRGLVSIIQVREDGTEVEVAQGGPGTIFGHAGPLGESERRDLVQALQYSVIFEIDPDSVKSVLAGNEPRKRAFRDALLRLDDAFQKRSKTHDREQEHAEHHHHRKRVVALLREHASRSLHTGFLTSIWHAVVPHRRKSELLDAIMAASALVVMADGELDDNEHDQVLETLAEADILRKMDRRKVTTRFDHYLKAIRSNKENGTKHALNAVSRIAGDTDLAHLVIAICHGVHGPQGTIGDNEHDMLVRIAEELSVSHHPWEVANLLQSTK